MYRGRAGGGRRGLGFALFILFYCFFFILFRWSSEVWYKCGIMNKNGDERLLWVLMGLLWVVLVLNELFNH
jgi:hypothetical protein